MANLAIKGHATRGSEVIALLEMLGGINSHNLYGDESYAYYTIDCDKEIKGGIYVFGDEELSIFTLEQFEEKFPYKVGDKVKCARINDFIGRITNVRWENSEEEIIYVVEWDDAVKSTLTYFARGLQPYKEETMETAKITITPQHHYNEDKIELCVAKDYEIKEENGKYYAVKKQSKYPKTYEECCYVTGFGNTEMVFEDDYRDINPPKEQWERLRLINQLNKLLICRDAYWKIAGKQMGLGKPWEPNWEENDGGYRYCIRNQSNKIVLSKEWLGENYILSFPTEEMRDAFYENFKELIETCKELL